MYAKILFLIFFCFPLFFYAQTSTPTFFGDNMVLQQNDSVAIWGKDKPGTAVEVSTSWGAKATIKTRPDGTWRTKLKTIAGSFTNYTVKIEGSNSLNFKNVLLGEVWFCSGQSNMEMPIKGFGSAPVNSANKFILNAENPNIRLFNSARKGTLKPETNVKGSWQEANESSVANFSAIGYLFGKKVFDNINVPVGIIEASWGGTKIEAWIPKDSLVPYKSVKISKTLPENPMKRKLPSQIFNGMIHPFQNFSIKGILWYQGESSRDHPEYYKREMHTLINAWRSQWSEKELPFYFVQIAPYAYKNYRKTPVVNAALIREAQLKASEEIGHTGLVITTDVGECDNIHPPEKELVADRLAYWALAKQYEFKNIWYKSPVYKSMEIKNNEILVHFDFGSDPNKGLSSFGEKIKGFTIAGKDKVFYPAEVKIKGNNMLTVYSKKVNNPVAVRYGFLDCFHGTLYSFGKLPVSPFRTDNWNQ